MLSHDGLHVAIDIGSEHLRHIAERFKTVEGVDRIQTKKAWKDTKLSIVELLDQFPFQAPSIDLWSRMKTLFKRVASR